MSYQLSVRPEVDDDIRDAEEWYDGQQSGLGKEFARLVRDEMGKLILNPLLYQVRHKGMGIRWLLLRRFPYHVIYQVRGEAITVIAVLHAHRHDRAWKGRV